MRKWIMNLTGLKARRGQTTAEYAIIVALVAVSSIAIIMIFGDQIRALFAGQTKAIAGDQNVTVDTSKAGEADGKTAGSLNKF